MSDPVYGKGDIYCMDGARCRYPKCKYHPNHIDKWSDAMFAHFKGSFECNIAMRRRKDMKVDDALNILYVHREFFGEEVYDALTMAISVLEEKRNNDDEQ